jgi:formamidopyrimidine-DNA glycosylase
LLRQELFLFCLKGREQDIDRKDDTMEGVFSLPELPEMENYRLLLLEQIHQQRITNVIVNREKSVNVPVDVFVREVKDKFITHIDRRAKHLLFYLDSGKVLLLHLMLGGWMYLGDRNDKPERTTQIEIMFGHQILYFVGLRLGYLYVMDHEQVMEELSKLGPEPFAEEFTAVYFRQLFEEKRGNIKSSLVNQKNIAGIGNCYADEICFSAKIIPTRKWKELAEGDFLKLYDAIRFVLSDAIRKGGYMEHPLFAGDRLTGGYDQECKVYDRKGEPCVRCSTPIVQAELSSRKVFYCPNCQE